MKKINLGLPDKLHTSAKVLAVLKNKTLQDYILEAVERAIKEDKKLIEELKALK